VLTLSTVVYVVSFAASSACAWLLVRSYLRSRTRLLLWSVACFVCLAVNNLLVIVDLVIFPEIDFGLARQAVALIGISALIYGFIWEIE
jgi:Family of unknown function (DUF5985)